ncbi:type II toxin-antitoxin system PemK/MazF family toxin [Arthrobacter sp. GCM10027362]|uniref:type II toxin-antitoxin system PemK/MazF family toxin n=1 Tax=Arthrobacter sp. GCM10027362 TaxID=3273379 RepID=UPI003626BFE7
MAFDTKTLGRILRGATKIIRAAAPGTGGTSSGRTGTPATGKTSPGRKPAAKAPVRRTAADKPAGRAAAGRGTPGLSSAYPGDFRGRAKVGYAPNPDGDPDPGEVVWTWVPFEEDYSQGKDRPVLLIGRNGKRLLGLMLTSKDRNNGSRRDGDYLDVGTGPWDSKGRPSEAKLDRVLQIDPRDIRREGAVMGKAAFDRVAKALRQLHGWS